MPNKRKKAIPGYDGRYAATRNGEIWSNLTNKELKPSRSGEYLRVTPYLYGVKKNEYVHRLVALTYIPNPHNYPQVMHLDGDTTNNAVSNLRWGTAYKNCNHKHTRRAHMRAVVKLHPTTNAYIARYNSCSYAAVANGGSRKSGSISGVCKGRLKTAYGYCWMYEEDYYRFLNKKPITKEKNVA